MSDDDYEKLRPLLEHLFPPEMVRRGLTSPKALAELERVAEQRAAALRKTRSGR